MVHNSQPTTHHGALDGGLAGGLLGHHGHNGHTGRDAAIGAVGGHVLENHHERHMNDTGVLHHHNNGPAVATGVGATGAAHHAHHTGTHEHRGLPVGTPGTTTTTTTTTVPKPSVGDKISGSVDVMVGKMTNNPAKVEIGEIKKHEGKAGLAAAGGTGAMGGARY